MYLAKPSAPVAPFRVLQALLVCLVLIATIPRPAAAATINVPADSATIQAAILGTLPGDTVLIAPGTYHENISFIGRSIVVRSSGGREATIIYGDSVNAAVRFETGEDTSAHLEGVTVRRGGAAGVLCTGASPTIHDCTIDSSTIGIDLAASQAIIGQCDILYNSSHGIRLTGSLATVTMCTLSDNGGSGIYGENAAVFTGNTLRRNGSYPLVLGAASIGRLAAGNQFMVNAIQAFGVLGGTVGDSAVWKPLSGISTFVILGGGDLSVAGPLAPTLVLDPGVRLEFAVATGTLSVGLGNPGTLIADAPSTNPISFVPHASIAQWRGIRFESNARDEECLLRNCLVRRSQGIVCNFSSPVFDSCRIDSCAGDGLSLIGSQSVIGNCVIADNSGVGIRLSSSQVPVTGCEISGNGSYGVYGTMLTAFSGNVVSGNAAAPLAVGPTSAGRVDATNSLAGNGDPTIFVLPGTVSASGTWRAHPGIERYVVASTAAVNVQGAATPVLTLAAGVRLEFGHPSYGLIVGAAAPGGLIAEGTEELPVLLVPAGPAASWGGLAFGASAVDSLCRLGHTVIRRAQTVACTDASPVLDSCRIDSCLGDGLALVNSQAQLTGCTIADNGGDGITISGLPPGISGCAITGNAENGVVGGPLEVFAGNTIGFNGGHALWLEPNSVGRIAADNLFSSPDQTIAVQGGIVGESAVWRAFPNVRRYLAGTSGIVYVQGAGTPVLTLSPGLRLEFPSASFGLRVGYTAAGGLKADALGGEPIVLTRDTNTASWAGLRFSDQTIDSASYLKNCIYRSARSLYVADASPMITDCTIDSCTESGLTLTNSVSRVLRSRITDNAVHGVSVSGGTPYLASSLISGNAQCGVYCANDAKPVIGSVAGAGCNLSRNGTFALYNDGAQTIYARENAWGDDDSAGVAALIWDQVDDPSKGWVQFMPFVLGYVCGDANGDGVGNPGVADVTYLVAYLFRGGPPPPEIDAADVNNDGAVRISDLAYLIAFLFRSGPAPYCWEYGPS